MTNGDGGAVSSHDLLDEPSRKRHWGRWSLGCLLVVVVVIVAVVVVFIELQPVPAPLVLSAWGITRPAGYGPLGSLADHGVVEFFLVLDR
jgi:hypothetical protein